MSDSECRCASVCVALLFPRFIVRHVWSQRFAARKLAALYAYSASLLLSSKSSNCHPNFATYKYRWIYLELLIKHQTDTEGLPCLLTKPMVAK